MSNAVGRTPREPVVQVDPESSEYDMRMMYRVVLFWRQKKQRSRPFGRTVRQGCGE